MNRCKNDPFQPLWNALDATGVPWRLGQQQTGHHNILPRSNLKPWTADQQSTLEIAAISAPHPCKGMRHGTTNSLTRADWTTYTPGIGKGFRVFTCS